MKTYKRPENIQKIIDGMELVRTRLIQYKIKMNSELVVMQNGKVVRIKPEELVLQNEKLNG
jgi:DNA-binding protein